MEYLDYSLEDFLADEPFQQWVLAPDEENSRFWKNWVNKHPDKQPLVTQACQILKSMALEENPAIQEKQIEKLWQRIESTRTLHQTISIISNERPKQIWFLPQYQRIAAVFIGLLICSIVFYLTRKPTDFIVHRTAYGKTKIILLPDQSTVMLNSNSSIRYAAHWDANQTREVWVEGEAFFSVIHTHDHQKFQVKTPSDMAVEVLGTQFNVKNRNSETRVVLKSGQVRLLISGHNKQKQIMMAPDESVELTKTAVGYIKKKVDPQQYLAWTQHKLIFKNTTIAEIKLLLEETYGLNVKISDANLMYQKISGSVPSNNLESLLFALSESFDYKIVKEKNQLLFLERSNKAK